MYLVHTRFSFLLKYTDFTTYTNPDRRRKKTREEFQHELFLRKRSRKSSRVVRADSVEINALEVDSDFGSDDGDDGCFFVNNPKGKAVIKLICTSLRREILMIRTERFSPKKH